MTALERIEQAFLAYGEGTREAVSLDDHRGAMDTLSDEVAEVLTVGADPRVRQLVRACVYKTLAHEVMGYAAEAQARAQAPMTRPDTGAITTR